MPIVRAGGPCALVLAATAVNPVGSLDTVHSSGPVRNSDIAVTLTGILLAGIGYFWREVLGMFGGLYRKYTDEAKLMENSETLRRVA
jgi:hypothetical protein